MKNLIVDDRQQSTRSIVSKGWLRLALGFCLLGLPTLLGYSCYQLMDNRSSRLFKDDATPAWAASLKEQKAELERAKLEALAQLQALTFRLASLQARLMGMDALAEKQTSVSGNAKDSMTGTVEAAFIAWADSSKGYTSTIDLDYDSGTQVLEDYGWLPKPPAGILKMVQQIAVAVSHVHVEHHKHGRVVDPASYVRSTIR